MIKILAFGKGLFTSVKYLESVEQMPKVGYNAPPICSNVHHIDPERSGHSRQIDAEDICKSPQLSHFDSGKS